MKLAEIILQGLGVLAALYLVALWLAKRSSWR